MDKQTTIEKRRAYDREWKRKERLKHPEKVRARGRAKYRKMREDTERLERHKEYHRKYGKDYDKTEKRREYRREWMRKWYRKNAKEIYARRRSKVHERIAASLRSRITDSLKYKVPRSARVKELLGCTVQEVKIHLEKQFTEGMSWDNYGKWHIDHIRPLASFDLIKASEQKKAFNYTNLQPLWAKDNMQKHTKILN